MATVPTRSRVAVRKGSLERLKRVPSLLASNIICLTLATIAVALRFLSWRMGRIKYQYDDWFIVAGLILSTAVIACQFTGVWASGSSNVQGASLSFVEQAYDMVPEDTQL